MRNRTDRSLRARDGGAVKTLAQLITSVFSGNVGAWLDPSDIRTLYQDSAGTTPVTAVTQPEGLVLDKSLGMVLGPETVINGDNEAALYTGAAAINTTITRGAAPGGGFAAVVTPINGLVPHQALFNSLAANKNYLISVRVYVPTGSLATARLFDAQDGSWFGSSSTLKDQWVTLTGIRQGKPALWPLGIGGAAAESIDGQVFYVDNLSIKELPGNHVLQATAAARPTLSAAINLNRQSNAFTTADWATANDGLMQNAVGIDGALSAWTLTDSSSAGLRYLVQTVSVVPSTQYTRSIYIKKTVGAQASYPCISFENASSQIAIVTVDTTNGIATPWTAFSGFTLIPCTATVADAGTFWRVSMTFTTTSVTANNTALYPAGANTANQSSGVVLATNTGSCVFTSSQLEFGPKATRYQSTGAAGVYDTIGFPLYLEFAGIDDSLASSTGGGGTAGFFFCAAIQREGGAGTLQTLWSDNGTNTGYKVQLDVNNKLSFSAGNGTAFTTLVSTPTVDVGALSLLTVWDDGVNLNAQIGSGAVVSVARPVVAAGTAGFTLGKDNGAASSFFIGDLYEAIYIKNSGLTAAQRSLVQSYVRSKAGI